MLKKCDTWPVVLFDDHGIRPAGRPDYCFYCHRPVGEPHASDCVTVVKIVEYDVCDVHGEVLGTYRRDEPYSWELEECEDHKNESSWCKDNALKEMKVTNQKALDAVLEAARREDRCLCGFIRFYYRETVEPGPCVEVEETTDV